ncbi:MAG: hypothetical protein K6E36_09970 [Oscillospiraceae bacterium]|nr:hypothetical protein [Oscillospiraceae bacterium]MCR5306814.1 hypothetical protein [Oscillospiraceae bacterium]
MKRTLTAALLAMMMTASLCACGTDTDSAASKPAGTSVSSTASASASDGKTTAAAESGTKAAADRSYGEKPSADDELATVKYLADTYFKAAKQNDYETLADIVAVDLLCCVSDGEAGDRDAQIEAVKQLCTTSDADGEKEVSDPQKETSAAEDYNKFFEVLDQESGGLTQFAKTFKVEDVYTVRVKTNSDVSTKVNTNSSGLDLTVDLSGTFSADVDLPIIKINGEWKVEPMVNLLMMFYDLASDLSDTVSAAAQK